MKNKQQIHAYISPETYLMLKTKKINVSSTVDELLTNYLGSQEVNEQEAEIQDQTKKIQQKIEMCQKELGILAAKLSVVHERKREEDQQREAAQIAAAWVQQERARTGNWDD